MAFLWPIDRKFRVSQGFGRPALRVEPTMWLAPDESRCRPTKFAGAIEFEDVHPGVDIACPVGTPIIAPADGRVAEVVEYRIFNPYEQRYVMGLYAMFRFDGGRAILHVDHLSRVHPEGSQIEKGQLWARTGESGVVTGPHAHLEIRTGSADVGPQASWGWFRQDPERYLRG